jgi:uncharacterized protein (DUF433 family)
LKKYIIKGFHKAIEFRQTTDYKIIKSINWLLEGDKAAFHKFFEEKFILTNNASHQKVNNMNGFIIVDPKICSGKPVIKGTRIMVKNILGMVAGGYDIKRIIDAYPELTREMIQAALEYAAAVIDEEQVIARA